MRTQRRSNRARWFNKLDSELSDEKQKRHRKPCRVCKDFFLHHRSRKYFTQTVPMSLLKLVKIYNGIMTPAHLIAQKQTERQEELAVEWKKEQLSHKCKADYQHDGGTVRWRTIDLCATCTTRWPMARQHSRRDMARQLTDYYYFWNFWLSAF